jgi:hypothetical protein
MIRLSLILCLALLAVMPPLSRADPRFEIDWRTVDDGGDMFSESSPSGRFVLSGTIGQADAGTMSSIRFDLTGGFWNSCPVSSPPQDDPTCPLEGCEVGGCGAKGRYVSFHAGDPGEQQAIRVTFVSLPPPHDHANARSRWVQQPYLVTENSGSSGTDPPPAMWAARLDCDPYYTDWSAYDVVDVFDDGIVALGTYDVQVIHLACNTSNESAYSASYSVRMSELGDVVGTRTAPPPGSPPECDCNFNDISACVDKFKNDPIAPRKARSDLVNATFDQPTPDQKVDFVDITCAVECFRGTPCWHENWGPPVDDPCGP